MSVLRPRIDVRCHRHWEQLRRLLAELEILLDVRVHRQDDKVHSGDAVVWFDATLDDIDDHPATSVPHLLHVGPATASLRPFTVAFTASHWLDRRLRGASFPMVATGWTGISARDGDEVLAHVDGTPVWIRRGTSSHPIHISGLQPEFGSNSTWEVEAERLVAMIPTTHLLRCVGGYDRSAREQFACFIIDDPNLRRPTYGHLRYRELVEFATGLGLHASIATIPLDMRWCDPKVVELFRTNTEQLSLSMHGNNHTRSEFATVDAESLERSLSQSLERTVRFERRSGLTVDRIVVPPHGAMSHVLPEVCGRFGLEAVSASPWAVVPARWHIGGGLSLGPTVGSAEGAPLLVRRHLVTERAWLPLHTFFDQPAIIYCHHEDLADGLDLMETAAGELEEHGPVRWCSLADIIRRSYACHVEDSIATLVMFAGRAKLTIPHDADQLIVHHTARDVPTKLRVLSDDDETATDTGTSIRVSAGESVDVVLDSGDGLGPVSGPSPSSAVWPIARRIMTEARDRLSPLVLRR